MSADLVEWISLLANYSLDQSDVAQYREEFQSIVALQLACHLSPQDAHTLLLLLTRTLEREPHVVWHTREDSIHVVALAFFKFFPMLAPSPQGTPEWLVPHAETMLALLLETLATRDPHLHTSLVANLVALLMELVCLLSDHAVVGGEQCPDDPFLGTILVYGADLAFGLDKDAPPPPASRPASLGASPVQQGESAPRQTLDVASFDQILAYISGLFGLLTPVAAAASGSVVDALLPLLEPLLLVIAFVHDDTLVARALRLAAAYIASLDTAPHDTHVKLVVTALALVKPDADCAVGSDSLVALHQVIVAALHRPAICPLLVSRMPELVAAIGHLSASLSGGGKEETQQLVALLAAIIELTTGMVDAGAQYELHAQTLVHYAETLPKSLFPLLGEPQLAKQASGLITALLCGSESSAARYARLERDWHIDAAIAAEQMVVGFSRSAQQPGLATTKRRRISFEDHDRSLASDTLIAARERSAEPAASSASEDDVSLAALSQSRRGRRGGPHKRRGGPPPHQAGIGVPPPSRAPVHAVASLPRSTAASAIVAGLLELVEQELARSNDLSLDERVAALRRAASVFGLVALFPSARCLRMSASLLLDSPAHAILVLGHSCALNEVASCIESLFPFVALGSRAEFVDACALFTEAVVSLDGPTRPDAALAVYAALPHVGAQLEVKLDLFATAIKSDTPPETARPLLRALPLVITSLLRNVDHDTARVQVDAFLFPAAALLASSNATSEDLLLDLGRALSASLCIYAASTHGREVVADAVAEAPLGTPECSVSAAQVCALASALVPDDAVLAIAPPGAANALGAASMLFTSAARKTFSLYPVAVARLETTHRVPCFWCQSANAASKPGTLTSIRFPELEPALERMARAESSRVRELALSTLLPAGLFHAISDRDTLSPSQPGAPQWASMWRVALDSLTTPDAQGHAVVGATCRAVLYRASAELSPADAAELLVELKDVADAHEAAGDLEMQRSVLRALGELGTVAEPAVLAVIVFAVMAPMLRPRSRHDDVLAGDGHWILSQMLRCRGEDFGSLLDLVAPHLAPILVAKLADSSTELGFVMHLLFGTQLASFLRSTLRYSIPAIVLAQSRANLAQLAKLLEADPARLLLMAIDHTIVYFLTERKDAFTAAMTFCVEYIDVPPPKLLRTSMVDVLKLLVLKLGNDAQQPAAIAALKFLAYVVDKDGLRRERALESQPSFRSVDLGKLLSPHFLGILDTANSALAAETSTTWNKREVVAALARLIECMDVHIGPMRLQLLGTLSRAMEQPELVAEACKAWNAFLNVYSVEAMGAMLTSVVVILAAHAQAAPKAALPILRRIFMDNSEAIAPLLKDLVLVIDAMLAANAHEMANMLRKQLVQRPLQELISLVVRGLGHDSPKVRLMSLVFLRNNVLLLKTRPKVRYMVLVASGTLPPAQVATMLGLQQSMTKEKLEELRQIAENSADVGALLPALLECCTESDEANRRAAGEALGALGALDPALVVRRNGRSGSVKASFACDEPSLIVELIETHLLRALARMQGSDEQVFASYTIQELLSVGGCNAETPARAKGLLNCDTIHQQGVAVWRKLSTRAREIVQPFLSTGYTVSLVAPIEGEVFVALDADKASYEGWLSGWAYQLTCMAAGESAELFQACRAIVQIDVSVAQVLLPHLVLNVVSIMPESGGGGRAGSRTATTPIYLDALVSEIVAVLSAGSSQSARRLPASVVQPAMQTVFTLLKQLEDLVASERRAEAAARKHNERRSSRTSPARSRSRARGRGASGVGRRQTPRALAGVTKLLKAIPHSLLAQASVQCGAHARALWHMEAACRSKHAVMAEAEAQPGSVVAQAAKAAQLAAKVRGGPGGQGAAALLATASSNSTINHVTPILARLVLSSSELALMQEVFARVGDPDLKVALSAFRKSLSLDEQILELKNSSKWDDAISCYEHAREVDPSNAEYVIGLLECLQHTGRWELMLSLVNAHITSKLVTTTADAAASITEYGLHAAWRLGKWDMHEFYDSVLPAGLARRGGSMGGGAGKPSFEIHVSKLLLLMRAQEAAPFADALETARADVAASLAIGVADSYSRAYTEMVQLGLLIELEEAFAFRGLSANAAEARNLLAEWQSRLELLSASTEARALTLHVRASALRVLGWAQDEGAAWVVLAGLYCDSKRFPAATTSLLRAQDLGLTVFVESAKVMWARGEQEDALSFLEKEAAFVEARAIEQAEELSTGALSEVSARTGAGESGRREKKRAETLLLMAQWMEATNKLYKRTIQRYTQVTKTYQKWEEGSFYLGQYYDRLLREFKKQFVLAAERKKRRRKGGSSAGATMATSADIQHPDFLTYLQQVLKYYGRSLLYGAEHIFQSLPRILTLWLDFGMDVHAAGPSGSPRSKGGKGSAARDGTPAETLKQCNKFMLQLLSRMYEHQWLVAFSQVISRIAHPVKSVYEVLEQIILHVMRAFPQQVLWRLVAVAKLNGVRRERALDLLKKAEQFGGEMKRLIAEFRDVTNAFLEVCNISLPKTKFEITVSKSLPRLREIMPLSVVIPRQAALSASPLSGSEAHYVPFPADLPCIESVADKIEVLRSLARPRKVTIRGSDGNSYFFLCKPRDDLRRDERVMEVHTMLNKLMKRDAESRRRRLHIRTYAVVPLNEDCGLIEWVNNTVPLRPILNRFYSEIGVNNLSSSLRNWYKEASDAGVSQIDLYADILRKLPPQLHKWFLAEFAEPTAWLQARTAYSRSLAVMSMVGAAIGLGDRHTENILFDSQSGEVVHVDFNCIFWKGSSFETPELVPFRLTPNIVDGLGLTGYEGPFRSVCEIVLQLLRNNKDALLSVLESFIHDPLIEWARGKSAARDAAGGGGGANPHALKVIRLIELHLEGRMVDASFWMSTPSHVQQMIDEATSKTNLSAMFIGWAPAL
ncbi:atypical/PIKK/ATR protein kinase [Thecamonas trahens ATCC 50062]|uniref:non-specific serine/threonine protein kinase n=1 Tax=Thecamonas trahens ATCC 50062 TaxID=461836 RepID=A0A0L0DR69_THETB|nr:atypical/PIKK/ATR protein kinase [Thecamonas trahens ATCC 50062]KNC54809.1 atypical/PIKK/ATR protein kinase [Thecamonas trahens ATCC 50062]|eukprot:XP_013761708.1 atypical/PIKK/ATR protein kinase [Thecamonas trahens ATCC 50062]